MKTSVYIESSVIRYLTARPSRDVVKSAYQAITIEWWQQHLTRHDAYISLLVEQEIARGNPEAADKRLQVAKDFKRLEISEAAENIAQNLLQSRLVPTNSEADALHIGIAAAQGVDFLLTWNFKHINNAYMKGSIGDAIINLGFMMPILCSPEELVGQR